MNDKDFRNKPLGEGNMSIKKLRKKLKKVKDIQDVGIAMRKYLTQFTLLELRWISTEINYNLLKKYKY